MIHVLYFAILKEKLGRAEQRCEVQPGETVAALAHRLLESVFGGRPIPLALRFAVNNEYVPADRVLQDGDEVALIPPVAGG